jgi:hypothetical protein
MGAGDAFSYVLIIIILWLLVSIVDKSQFIVERRAKLGGYPLGSYDAGRFSYADSVLARP